MEKDILAASSPYQVGGQPGHSADENILVIKSIMALTEYTGKGFIFNSVDIIYIFIPATVHNQSVLLPLPAAAAAGNWDPGM